ncbi:MAG: hypothetical protein LBU25_02195 [Treponema sp.]|jgi:hypothetical protein|nr:hypothetical protein [Treponema sp.]
MKKNTVFLKAAGKAVGLLAVLLAFEIILAACPTEDSEPSDPFDWSRVSNLPFGGVGSAVQGIAYGKGVFVSVSSFGESAYSSDGKTWTKGGTVISSGTITCLGFGNGTFVAGLYSGGFAYSTDGNTWTAATGSLGIPVADIIYADNTFMAVGLKYPAYKMATSNDGTAWHVSNGPQYIGNSICYGAGTFVAVGNAGSIAYSSNGTAWTDSGTRAFGSTHLIGAAYGDNTFVVVGESGKIGYSSDGSNWTLAESPFGASHINTLVYGGGTFVAGTYDGKIAVSSDGKSWNGYQPFGSHTVDCIAFGDGTFVAGGAESVVSLKGWIAYAPK